MSDPVGLVIASHGRRARVRGADGAIYDCAARRRVTVAAGDRVRWRPLNAEQGVIESRLPRASELSRPDARGRRRIMAANVDRVLVVIAGTPAITPAGLDAYLVAVELLGIPLAIVHNKWDLLDAGTRARTAAELARYEPAGYPTLAVSAAEGTGMRTLRAELAGRVSVLIGPSGVGKSSLVRRLVPQAAPEVGALTRDGTLGSHTTTAAVLYALPSGGALIDSPGIREFGLWSASPREIAEGFPELRAASPECRFRDCLHLGDAGCAVPQALAAGRLHPERLAAYRQLAELYDGGASARQPAGRGGRAAR